MSGNLCINLGEPQRGWNYFVEGCPPCPHSGIGAVHHSPQKEYSSVSQLYLNLFPGIHYPGLPTRDSAMAASSSLMDGRVTHRTLGRRQGGVRRADVRSQG